MLDPLTAVDETSTTRIVGMVWAPIVDNCANLFLVWSARNWSKIFPGRFVAFGFGTNGRGRGRLCSFASNKNKTVCIRRSWDVTMVLNQTRIFSSDTFAESVKLLSIR